MAQLSFWMIYNTRLMRIYFNNCRTPAHMMPAVAKRFGGTGPMDAEERKKEIQIMHRL